MDASANTSYVGVRSDLLSLIPEGDVSRVLDVGCANGATSAVLKQSRPSAHVTGIELDPSLAAVARTRLDRVLLGDAVQGLQTLIDEGAHFDVVLCGDVLEHLVDPWQTLALIHRLTRGHVIVSLPNVGHFSTLWSLAFGKRWPYRDRGIHDRTHLRFFAAGNLPELFASAGFTEVRRKQQHRLFERPHPLNEKLNGAMHFLPGVSGLTCYQFLSVLRPL
jgi:2-polyprenyl-3-methyl-5-hydroxy-6-metoxy-1,4-benzoquinol methylase